MRLRFGRDSPPLSRGALFFGARDASGLFAVGLEADFPFAFGFPRSPKVRKERIFCHVVCFGGCLDREEPLRLRLRVRLRPLLLPLLLD